MTTSEAAIMEGLLEGVTFGLKFKEPAMHKWFVQSLGTVTCY